MNDRIYFVQFARFIGIIVTVPFNVHIFLPITSWNAVPSNDHCGSEQSSHRSVSNERHRVSRCCHTGKYRKLDAIGCKTSRFRLYSRRLIRIIPTYSKYRWNRHVLHAPREMIFKIFYVTGRKQEDDEGYDAALINDPTRRSVFLERSRKRKVTGHDRILRRKLGSDR